MIQGHIHDEIQCPHCKHMFNGFTGVTTEQMPEDGDINICIYCYSVGQYTENLTKIKLLTNNDLLHIQRTQPEAFEQIKLAIKVVYRQQNKK